MPFSLSTPILDFFRNDLGLCAHNSVLQDIPNLSSRSFDWLVLRGTIATALRARETPGGIQLEVLKIDYFCLLICLSACVVLNSTLHFPLTYY